MLLRPNYTMNLLLFRPGELLEALFELVEFLLAVPLGGWGLGLLLLLVLLSNLLSLRVGLGLALGGVGGVGGEGGEGEGQILTENPLK